MRCGEIETDPTQDDLTVYLNETSYYSSTRRLCYRRHHYGSSYGEKYSKMLTPQESQSCLTPIPKACMCQSQSPGRGCMFHKTKEIKTCCGKSTFGRWRQHHSLQHVCRVMCWCRLQMWFAVEKKKKKKGDRMYFFFFLSGDLRGRDVGGLARTHAHVYICCVVCRVCSHTQCHCEHTL